MKIEDIIQSVREERIRISDHADEEAYIDNLSYDEIFMSLFNGEIIEYYPDDKPYPSCLIYGRNFKEDPIHSVWGYNSINKWSVLITVYRPDPNKWIDWKIRRKSNDSI